MTDRGTTIGIYDGARHMYWMGSVAADPAKEFRYLCQRTSSVFALKQEEVFSNHNVHATERRHKTEGLPCLYGIAWMALITDASPR